MLNVHGLTKRYGDYWALRGASFSIRAGEVLGLVSIDGGNIRPDEPLIPRKRRDLLFYMPDGILPWPEQTVGWTLRFFASLHGALRAEVADIARNLDVASLQRK